MNQATSIIIATLWAAIVLAGVDSAGIPQNGMDPYGTYGYDVAPAGGDFYGDSYDVEPVGDFYDIGQPPMDVSPPMNNPPTNIIIILPEDGSKQDKDDNKGDDDAGADDNVSNLFL